MYPLLAPFFVTKRASDNEGSNTYGKSTKTCMRASQFPVIGFTKAVNLEVEK